MGQSACRVALGIALWASLGAGIAAAAPPPEPRPETLAETAAAVASGRLHRAPADAVRPDPRPPASARSAPAATPALFGWGDKSKLCGVRGLDGRSIAPIPGRLRGCGLRDGVEISAVAGVRLSRPARIDCPTARALLVWVETGVKTAIGDTGGGVVQLEVAGHYVCRTRNGKPGAKISEHGKGRAVDISGFRLASGSVLDIRRGWRHPSAGPVLRRIHRAACGPFGTVLGPAADRYHQGHFHLDTARYRSGAYCR